MKISELSRVGQGETVITVNRRLASHLQQQYNQMSQDQQTWTWPDILPLDAWLIRAWQHTQPTETLLSQEQAMCLWQQVTDANWQSAALISQAWTTLHHWALGHNAAQHLHWAAPFERLCKQHNSLTLAQLPALLENTPVNVWLPTQTRLQFVGFDDMHPALNQLIRHLTASGIEVVLPQPQHSASLTRHLFSETDEEIQHMAQWAAQIHRTDPSARIACIVPALTTHRAALHTAFASLPANIAAGEPLSHFPLIQTAIAILNEDWTSCLLSPYFCTHAVDRDCAAALDAARRNHSVASLDHPAIHALAPALIRRFPKTVLFKR